MIHQKTKKARQREQLLKRAGSQGNLLWCSRLYRIPFNFGRIIERPVAIAGEIKIRPMMYLALSYDHRVIDGSSSVTFLVKVKKLLEDPMTLMLEI